jgi:LEA14-like dessication related protein
MTDRQILGIIGLVAVGVYFWGKSQAGKKLKITIDSIKFDKLNFAFQPTFTVNFLLTNNSNFSLNINSLFGDVYLNGVKISTVSENSTINVPANKSINFPVSVSVSLVDTILEIERLIRNGDRLNIKFVGVVNAEGLNFPINEMVQF